MPVQRQRNKPPSHAVKKRLGSETLYDVLQVSSSADPTVLRAAYHALARLHHPDVNSSSDAAERMRAINEAWELLSDPKRRAKYDLSMAGERPLTLSQAEEAAARRLTICWRCNTPLAGAFARYCSICHWLHCEKCRGCGCQHPAWKARFEPQRRRTQALVLSGWIAFALVSLGWVAASFAPVLRAATP